METVGGIRTNFSEWMDPTDGRVILPFSGVHDVRGTWHVPPREGLQKLVANPAGQTGGTADTKFAGHAYTAPTCVLLWLPLLWGAGCTRQERKTFLTRGPPVQGNFELGTRNSVHGYNVQFLLQLHKIV